MAKGNLTAMAFDNLRLASVTKPLAVIAQTRNVGLLLLLLSAAPLIAGDPPNSTSLNTSALEVTSTTNEIKSPADRQREEIAREAAAIRKRLRRMAEKPVLRPSRHSETVGLVCVIALAILASPAGLMIVLRYRRAESFRLQQTEGPQPFESLWQEEPSLRAFFEGLRAGPAVQASAALVETSDVPTADLAARDLREWASLQMVECKRAFAEAYAAAEAPARKAALGEISRRLVAMKDSFSLPDYTPLWQLLCALEALAAQLSRQDSKLKPSCIKTVSAGLACAHHLCAEGLPPGLTSALEMRLLVVDDDAVSRRALCMALKRAFAEPDVAPDSKTALTFAAQHVYDIVFMDVEMPRMDGFEACCKIHETVLNRDTPVVFVTNHHDFPSRAKAAECGGYELIAKPILPLEMVVKALTLTLTVRMAGRSRAAVPVPETVASAQPADAFSIVSVGELVSAAAPSSAGASAEERADTDRLRELLESARALYTHAENAHLAAAQRLGSALQELLQRLLDRPELSNITALGTAESALELLHEICQAKADLSLAEPPIRILAVDDDLIARRAIASAIQMVFGKPDTAEDGEAALEMAREKTYDLVFMDILMPRMNGFITCEELHGLEPNRDTPVVFVTSLVEPATREKAELVGGAGFITKPILSKEILLTALTFVLRARLQRQGQSQPCQPAVA